MYMLEIPLKKKVLNEVFKYQLKSTCIGAMAAILVGKTFRILKQNQPLLDCAWPKNLKQFGTNICFQHLVKCSLSLEKENTFFDL